VANIFCSKCGFTSEGVIPEGQEIYCLQCGNPMKYEETHRRNEAPQDIQSHSLTFTGTAGEYFRIWIVNVFLTVITLGIYAAWAKVRTRRYFYANTKLAGQAFSYLGDPKAILKGNLIIGGGFAVYMIIKEFVPMLSGIIGILLYIAFPLLIYKSLRFNARNSAYRNIRFRFLGTLKESYITYIFLPALIPFTLGLIIPYWEFRRKDYFFGNLAFGTTAALFRGRSKPFYLAYFRVFLTCIGIVIASAFFVGFAGNIFKQPVFFTGAGFPKGIFFAFILLAYALFLIIAFAIQQYFYARFMNYCWGKTQMGKLQFRSTLSASRLAWIRISSIFAIILSLGLLAPWAKIRRNKYILENLAIVTEDGLDTLTASLESDEQNAVGDAATDFFDIDIGL
jgi:uncharacterized membrane protein YjgN (DUF898 family)